MNKFANSQIFAILYFITHTIILRYTILREIVSRTSFRMLRAFPDRLCNDDKESLAAIATTLHRVRSVRSESQFGENGKSNSWSKQCEFRDAFRRIITLCARAYGVIGVDLCGNRGMTVNTVLGIL